MNRRERRRLAKLEKPTARRRAAGDDIDALLTEAVDHQMAGNAGEATKICRSILDTTPDHAVACDMLGVLLAQSGQPEEAVDYLAKAAELEADDPRYHNNLANVMSMLERYEESAASFRSSLDLRPDSAPTCNSYGAVLKQLGRLDEAEAQYRRAIELDPDFTVAHDNLATVLSDQGRTEETAES